MLESRGLKKDNGEFLNHGEILALTKSFFDDFSPEKYGYNPFQYAEKLLDYADISPITPNSKISNSGFELNGYLVNLFWNFMIAYMDFYFYEIDSYLKPEEFKTSGCRPTDIKVEISDLKISCFYNFSLSEFFNLDTFSIEKLFWYYSTSSKDFDDKKVYDILNPEKRDNDNFKNLKVKDILDENVSDIINLDACKDVFLGERHRENNIFDEIESQEVKLSNFLGYKVERYFNLDVDNFFTHYTQEKENTKIQNLRELELHSAIKNGIKETIYFRKKTIAALNKLYELVLEWKKLKKKNNKINEVEEKNVLIFSIALYCREKYLSSKKISLRNKLLLFTYICGMKNKKLNLDELKKYLIPSDINMLFCFNVLHKYIYPEFMYKWPDTREGKKLNKLFKSIYSKYVIGKKILPYAMIKLFGENELKSMSSELEKILRLEFIDLPQSTELTIRKTVLAGLCYSPKLNAYYVRKGHAAENIDTFIYRPMEMFIILESEKRTIDKFKRRYTGENGKIVFNLSKLDECFSFFFYYGYLKNSDKTYNNLYNMLNNDDANKLFRRDKNNRLMFETIGAKTITAKNIAECLDLSAFDGNAIYCLENREQNIETIEPLIGDRINEFKIVFGALPEYKKRLTHNQLMKIPEQHRIEFDKYLNIELENKLEKESNSSEDELSEDEFSKENNSSEYEPSEDELSEDKISKRKFKKTKNEDELSEIELSKRKRKRSKPKPKPKFEKEEDNSKNKRKKTK